MSSLTRLAIELEIGQTIVIKGRPAVITKIEYFEKSGEIILNTTGGTRKALTFSIPTETVVQH